MKIYYSYMETDIDRWKTLSLIEPEERPEDADYWNYDIWEITSLYHFLEVAGDLNDYDNGEKFFNQLETIVKSGVLPWHDN